MRGQVNMPESWAVFQFRFGGRKCGKANDLLLLLTSELPRISFVRSTKGLFKDQLTHPHAGYEFHFHCAVVAYFELDWTREPSVNGGSGDVNPDAQSRQ